MQQPCARVDRMTFALERLKRQHGVEYELAPAPPAEPSASCAASLHDRLALPTRSGRGESTARTLALLRRLRARQAADAMRREFEKKEGIAFAWVVLVRPDVAFADDIPVDRMCTVPGGRRVHVPWFHSRGGANERFMMGPPEGAEEYLSMYDALCDEKNAHAIDPPAKKGQRGVGRAGGGAGGGVAGGGGGGVGGSGAVPRSTDTIERLYAWHLRRRHVTVDPWALFHFVFYRVRTDVPFDHERSPDLQFSQSAFNPTTSRWSEVLEELEGCPAVLEREAAREAARRPKVVGGDRQTGGGGGGGGGGKASRKGGKSSSLRGGGRGSEDGGFEDDRDAWAEEGEEDEDEDRGGGGGGGGGGRRGGSSFRGGVSSAVL
jgi:hypothetical protein